MTSCQQASASSERCGPAWSAKPASSASRAPRPICKLPEAEPTAVVQSIMAEIWSMLGSGQAGCFARTKKCALPDSTAASGGRDPSEQDGVLGAYCTITRLLASSCSWISSDPGRLKNLPAQLVPQMP